MLHEFNIAYMINEHAFDVPEGKGTYSLILALDKDTDITAGSLGVRHFHTGYYSYTGSARGAGGFARVIRHLAVAAGTNSTRHWHIDYLLPHTMPKGLVLSCADIDIECTIAKAIGHTTRTMNGFGCSDCRCSGHLHYETDFERLFNTVKDAHKITDTIHKVYSF
ncbi:MAG: GIY-YIG nuclease family protein [ANME-2 cluster archaeon]|nr:GIY-YIG nuclease family protein [ANME-2 cluster archaeon]